MVLVEANKQPLSDALWHPGTWDGLSSLQDDELEGEKRTLVAKEAGAACRYRDSTRGHLSV